MSATALADQIEAVSAPESTPPAPQKVGVDDTHIAAASYANFCRVTGTPEE